MHGACIMHTLQSEYLATTTHRVIGNRYLLTNRWGRIVIECKVSWCIYAKIGCPVCHMLLWDVVFSQILLAWGKIGNRFVFGTSALQESTKYFDRWLQPKQGGKTTQILSLKLYAQYVKYLPDNIIKRFSNWIAIFLCRVFFNFFNFFLHLQ